MDQKYNPALRVISTIVLSFFIWTFGGVFEVAYAVKESSQPSAVSPQRRNNNAQSSAPSRQPEAKKVRPEEKFGKAIEDVESILKDDKADHETKKQRIRSKKAEIDAEDIELRKQFTETEGNIKDLPEVIKKRHRDFVKHYENNLSELKTNLNDIDKAKTDTEKEQAHRKAKDFLERVKPPKKHQALDPNKLPHRTEEPVFKEPRTKPEEFENEKGKVAGVKGQGKPILVAANGSLEGLLSSNTQYNTKTTDLLPEGSFQLALANPPTSADLAETIEVKFTPAITAKAAELGNKPVKIYEWVRNNIEYVPTYGSMQGADMCLQTKLCNDFDTASLLIALLRASGIHARYVYGTVELPIDKVKNWAGGFTDTMSALSLFASAGVPTKGMTVGGEIKYARLEHVWVEAFTDYIPSRGSRHRAGEGDTWIPLDASFKQYTYTQGIDIKTAVPFDAQAFIDQVKNTATINEAQGYATGVNSLLVQQAMQDYQSRVQSYISQNYPNATVGDVLGKKEIVKEEFPYLLGTLPYKTIVKGATYSSIPDSKRHKITFNVTKDLYDSETGTPINITKSLPELAGKKITLSYLPASAADEQVLINYGYYNAPPYLVNLIPVLFINGINVAEGSSIGMGYDESLKITFSSPNKEKDVVEHTLTSSSYVAIGLSPQNITNELIKTRYEKLNAAAKELNLRDVPVDELFGEILNIHALVYFRTVEIFDKLLASSYGVAMARHTAELTVTYRPTVKYFFGTPYDIGEMNMEIDVKRRVSSQASLDGNLDNKKKFMVDSGIKASAMEHSIFEFLQPGVIGVSTVKILNEANKQGIPVFSVNNANKSSILPLLKVMPETLNDINNAGPAGRIITVPAQTIQYYNWYGDGYIISDSETGSGDYLISGKLLGGGIACNQANNATIQNMTIYSSSISGGTQSCPADDGFGSLTQFNSSMSSGGASAALGWIVAKNKFSFSTVLQEAVGNLGIVLSSFYAAVEMYEKTNSHVAAQLAFMANSLVSLVFAKIIEQAISGNLTGMTLTIVVLTDLVAQIWMTDTLLILIQNQFTQK